MISDSMRAGITSLRPFVPAKDFRVSYDFYEALGFKATPIDDKLADMQLGLANGAFAFLLQAYYVKEFAENLMMHLLVDDLDAWWQHVDALALERTFGVAPPRAPVMQPWGLRVAYIFDPSGVLWHLAQER